MSDGREDSAKHQSSLEIILGPAGSGKTAACLEEWARFGSRGLLLAPTALAMEERLASEGLLPIWGRVIMTAEQLARWVIRRGGRPERRILTHTLKTLLLREVVEGREISYLRGVRNRAGFYRALGELISELKAAGVSPQRFEEVTRARGMRLSARPALADKDREVAGIYAAFQGRLDERGWAEEEDLIAEAASLLQEDANLLAQDYDAVLADGFWEFSGVELRLLEAICGAAQRVKVTLPWEEGREAFAYTDRTLSRLSSTVGKRHPHTQTLMHPHSPPAGSLAYLERHIFTPPSAGGQVGKWASGQVGTPHNSLRATHNSLAEQNRAVEIEDGTLAFLEAAGEEGEVEMVAREIRKITAGGGGIRPEKILVIIRELGPYSRYLGRYFREYGIPFSLSARVPLLEIPLARALECLLRVIGDGWQRRDVLALLKSGYLPIEPEKANWVEGEARKRGIFRGREEWLRDLTPEGNDQSALAGGQPPRPPSLAAQSAEANRQKEEALSLVGRVEDALGKRPTPAAFRATLLSWMKEKAVQERLAAAEAGIVRLDGLALLQVDELLREMEEAMGPDARAFALDDLANRLRAGMAAAWVESAPGQRGVVCLDAAQARHFAGEVVFVLGLNEKVFPRPARQEPFYADWEREDDRHIGGLGLRTSRQEAERERLLFYTAVTRARRKLYLCRPRTDNEGKERQESFFLYELKRLFSPESVKARTERRDMSEVVAEVGLTESEALNLAAVRSAECGVQSADQVREAGSGLPGGGSLDFQLAEVARVMNWEPEARLGAGEFEVPSIFSASSLETYASCPFRFFAEQVLRLKVPEEEIGPKERGQLLHQVLSRLLEEERDWREERREALVRKAREILEQDVKASGYGRRDERGYRLGLLREAVLLLLDRFVEEELRLRLKLPEFRPAHFELSFGYEVAPTFGSATTTAGLKSVQPDDGSVFLLDGPCATLDPFGYEEARAQPKSGWEADLGITGGAPESALVSAPKPLTIGGSILIRGRIDRVDLQEGTRNCAIYDYKSGKTEFNADEMRQGTSLQLPLYLLAAAEIWGLKPLAGLFYSRGGPSSGIVWREMEARLGFRAARKKRLVVSDLEEVREIVVPVVEELVGRIREGVFPAVPGERCRWCQLGFLCRQERPRR